MLVVHVVRLLLFVLAYFLIFKYFRAHPSLSQEVRDAPRIVHMDDEQKASTVCVVTKGCCIFWTGTALPPA
jgi:hypothetical protein